MSGIVPHAFFLVRAGLTSALSTAVLEGKARALDLQLASRVAAGALRETP